MKLFLKTTNNRYEEVDILNKNDLKLTKIIKDFANLNDVKSSFSTNVNIKYTPQNLRVFGYYTNITTTDFSGLINGLDAIITTESGDYIMNGQIIINQIDKLNENFIVNLLFTSHDAGFYNNLNAVEFTIPTLSIPNDYSTKLAHNSMKIQQFHDDSEPFIYGLVDNGYNLPKSSQSNNDDPAEGYSLNNGFFSHEVMSCSEDSISTSKSWDYNAPLQYGYGALPSQLMPLIRYEWLFEQLHSGAGYTYEGEIFNNQEFYNLAIAPKYNVIDRDLLDDISDFSFSGSITGSTANQGVFLECDTPTNDLFYRSGSIPYTVQPGTLYEVNDSHLNDYEKLFGKENGYEMNNLKWKKNFTTSITMKVTIDITHDGTQQGYIRLIVADGIYTPNTPDTTNNPGKATMNPYSFHLVDDIYLESTSSGSYVATYEKEFEVSEVHYTAMMNSGYFVRGEVINQITSYSGNIDYDFRVDFTGMKLDETVECGNAYNLEDVATLDFSEQKFMKDFITKFNIIPQVNIQDKKITYYTFDEFYNYPIELDWTEKILRDKKMTIDYSMKDIKSIYRFNNECSAKNELIPDEYGNKDVSSEHKNKSNYEIKNDIKNMFYKETFWYDTRGVYNEESKTPSGFPLIMNNAVNIVNQDFRMADNSLLDDDRIKWDDGSKLSNCLIGYPKQIFGKNTDINGYEVNGVIVYNEYNTIEMDIMRKDYDASHATGQTEFYYPYFLGPLNKIDSDDFVLDNKNYNNSLTYNDISLGKNMYRYYDREISNLINTQSHTITAYVKLTESEYKDISMRETIIIDSNRYILKTVSNFQIDKPTKITLLSWENRSGWTEKYNGHQSDISLMIQSGTTNTPDISIKYRLDSYTGDTFLTLNTDYHEVGKRYKLKMRLGTIDGGVYLHNLYLNGLDGTAININHNLPAGSYEWVEVEYVRTSGDFTSSDSILYEASNNSTKFYVYDVILEEYN